MVELTVNGMRCGPCARAVTDAVRSIDPVAEVKIDLESKLVSIETHADVGQLRAAIESAGYQVEFATVVGNSALLVKGERHDGP